MLTPDQIKNQAAIAVARETLAQYNNREGKLDRPDTWDLVMAARFSSDVEALLDVIDRLQA